MSDDHPPDDVLFDPEAADCAWACAAALVNRLGSEDPDEDARTYFKAVMAAIAQYKALTSIVRPGGPGGVGPSRN